MSQSLVLHLKGLYTSFNAYSEAPDGALIEATNIEIAQESIAEPRRGFDRDGGELVDTNQRIYGLFDYKSTPYSFSSVPNSGTQSLYYNASDTWNLITVADPIDGHKVRTAESNQNLYFNTLTGIQKLTNVSAFSYAGAPKALNFRAQTNNTDTPAWFPDGKKVAYRHVWTKTDVNGNLVIGTPSSITTSTNATGSAIAQTILVVTPAIGITEEWTLQVYRSEIVDISLEPSDEMQLVVEKKVTLNGTRFTVSLSDTCTEETRGAFLYTSASQQGLAAGNNPPPYSTDLAQYDGSMFYSNYYTPYNMFLTLSFLGGTKGIAVNDTLTFTSTSGTFTITAKSSENVALGQFQLFTSGATEEENIRLTTESLLQTLNTYSSSFINGFLLSGPDDPPGQMYFEMQYNFDDPTFTVISSNTTCWTPIVPSSGTSLASTRDQFINGITWSKSQQPDHVPLTNTVQVGSKNNDIMRIVPLRDALYIFKRKEGVYKLTGSYPNYSIDLFDASVKLVAPESAVVVNNSIYCLTDKGIMKIDDASTLMSEPINSALLKTSLQNIPQIESLSFGVAYEPEMKYYLFLPGSSVDTGCTFAYVYNLTTGCWTTHNMRCRAGLVFQDRKLHLGMSDLPYMFTEQKTYTYSDYADYKSSDTVTAIDSRTMTLASGTANVVVGDVVRQSSVLFSSINAIDPITQTITIDSNPGFTEDPIDIYSPINTVVTWAPQALQNPGILKHFHTATLLFKTAFIGLSQLSFKTDISKGEEFVDVTGDTIGVWGLFPWGQSQWGGVSQDSTIRQWIPRNKQQGSEITISFKHGYGYSPWELLGLSLFGNAAQEKVQK